ncbi:50S ribosomal protein L18 [Granulicatella seriolae]|uniref:Large ribosomal subunit protein uL18 n=1 Tax=Granulicatella seriolae TaxID=2967226 RepID=A0ABT1WM50_9LACT|nr:50S ribosomal protein L18 [Granulicatella seriolae]
MISKPDKNKVRQARHARVRRKISGTAECPRLNVFRSNKNIYAQLIDDVAGVTLASASTVDTKVAEGTKTSDASAVGKLIAERGLEKNIKKVVFDRGGYLYHGRVKALAEAARENGLEF